MTGRTDTGEMLRRLMQAGHTVTFEQLPGLVAEHAVGAGQRNDTTAGMTADTAVAAGRNARRHGASSPGRARPWTG